MVTPDEIPDTYWLDKVNKFRDEKTMKDNSGNNVTLGLYRCNDDGLVNNINPDNLTDEEIEVYRKNYGLKTKVFKVIADSNIEQNKKSTNKESTNKKTTNTAHVTFHNINDLMNKPVEIFKPGKDARIKVSMKDDTLCIEEIENKPDEIENSSRFFNFSDNSDNCSLAHEDVENLCFDPTKHYPALKRFNTIALIWSSYLGFDITSKQAAKLMLDL